MYKVEYLVLLDNDSIQCKTVKALKSLFESNSEVTIEKNNITHKKYTTAITIKLGKKDNAAHLFFDISLECSSQDNIEEFSDLLKAIRGCLAMIAKNHYVIWDDLSLFYAQQAYPLIYSIENLLRQLITKFMLTNIGVGWTKDRVPTDVQQSINPNNKDINYLNNVDFIQLKNFLFSESYPIHKESLITELKNAKDLSALNLEQIKSLLPISNWNKYFKPLVDCEGDYLQRRWETLYNLRCNVAHNKTFLRSDLEEVKKLSTELKTHLEKALINLDKIVVTDDDKEHLAENVAINTNEAYGKFLLNFKELEFQMRRAVKAVEINQVQPSIYTIRNLAELLLIGKIFTQEDFKSFIEVNNYRNQIIHAADDVFMLDNVGYYGVIVKHLTILIKNWFADQK